MRKTKEKKTTTEAKTKTNKLTALERLSSLENMILSQHQKIEILADEIDKLRGTVGALAKRLNATIKAGEDGSLSNDSVNKLIINENLKELEGKVKFLVEQNVLEKDDSAVVSNKTFVVGREVDKEGTVINPRVQFAVGSLDANFQTQVIGFKVGDVIPYQESDVSLEVVEIYKIKEIEVKKQFEESKQEVSQ